MKRKLLTVMSVAVISAQLLCGCSQQTEGNASSSAATENVTNEDLETEDVNNADIDTSNTSDSTMTASSDSASNNSSDSNSESASPNLDGTNKTTITMVDEELYDYITFFDEYKENTISMLECSKSVIGCKDDVWSVRIVADSVDSNEAYISCKMVVEENENIQILYYHDIISEVQSYEVQIYDKASDEVFVQWMNEGDNLYSTTGNKSNFDDFDTNVSASAKDVNKRYEGLTLTTDIQNYVGYYVTGLEGTSCVIITDADGNEVAYYIALGEKDYKNALIVSCRDERLNDLYVMDGIDISDALDSDGNLVCVF